MKLSAVAPLPMDGEINAAAAAAAAADDDLLPRPAGGGPSLSRSSSVALKTDIGGGALRGATRAQLADKSEELQQSLDAGFLSLEAGPDGT